MTDLSKNIEALREKKAVIEMGGGEAAIEKQVAMGNAYCPGAYLGFVG